MIKHSALPPPLAYFYQTNFYEKNSYSAVYNGRITVFESGASGDYVEMTQ